MFLQLLTLRRHVPRLVVAGVSLSAVHIFSFCAGEIAEEAWPSGFSYLETLFQGGTTTFVLQGQLPLFRHDTFSLAAGIIVPAPVGEGRGVSVVMLNSFGFPATCPAATRDAPALLRHALLRHALRRHALRRHALRRHALRRHALWRRAKCFGDGALVSSQTH